MSTFFKRGAVALLALAVLVLPVLLTACNKIKLADYPAIPTSFAYETDGNATVAQAGTDFEMPFNPSRGMRGETYLTLGSGGEAFPSSGDDAMRRLDAQLESFADEGITLMQVYIYLTNYCNDPLPESALEELKTYMTAVRERGVKMLLRFAYEYSESNKKGPRTRDIIGHCEQLKSFFEQNAELFDDTVYAVQLGMIGLWGEGHSSVHSLNERKIIKAVADMVPDDVFVMVRTPKLLTKVPEEEEPRFGVHDDYLVGRDDEWGMMDWSDPEYAKLLRKCKFALTDGEMPWGDQSPDAAQKVAERISDSRAARRARLSLQPLSRRRAHLGVRLSPPSPRLPARGVRPQDRRRAGVLHADQLRLCGGARI